LSGAEDDSATHDSANHIPAFSSKIAEMRFLFAFSSHRPMVIVPEVMNWRQNYNWQVD
jgi:hypothetical protein